MEPTQAGLVADHIAAAQHYLKELPPSRERSMVATKLDEARLWLAEILTMDGK